jgi:uncharacterized integral membrane protein
VRYLRYLFVAILGLSLFTLALANRGWVTLRLLPEEMAALIGVEASVEMPLFLVAFAGIVLGLLIGFLWEWLREHKHRAAAAAAKREAERLGREVSRLREANTSPEDEVLALLEKPRKAG